MISSNPLKKNILCVIETTVSINNSCLVGLCTKKWESFLLSSLYEDTLAFVVDVFFENSILLIQGDWCKY